MSNYPAGVTGNEFEIAGPDWEGDVEIQDCQGAITVDGEQVQCEFNGTVDAQAHQGEVWYACPKCGMDYDTTATELWGDGSDY